MNKKDLKIAVKKFRKIAKNNSNYITHPFFSRWLQEFAPELTISQYRKYIHKQFIWHAFSFNIIPKEKYLEGNDARKAYNNANKDCAIALQLYCEDTPTALTEQFDTAEKLETVDGSYDEFYVVGKDFSWTYILTHETSLGFGPYFMQNKK